MKRLWMAILTLGSMNLCMSAQGQEKEVDCRLKGFEGSMMAGTRQSAQLEMSNQSSSEKNIYHLYIWEENGEGGYITIGFSQQIMHVAPGEIREATADVYFYDKVGSTTFYLADVPADEITPETWADHVLDSRIIDVQPFLPLDVTASVQMDMTTMQNGVTTLMGRKLMGDVTMVNNDEVPLMPGDYDAMYDFIDVRFFRAGDQQPFKTQQLARDLYPGDTVNVEFAFSYPFEHAEDYAVSVGYDHLGDYIELGRTVFRANTESCTTYWKKDGSVSLLPRRDETTLVIPEDAVAVDLRWTDQVTYRLDITQANPNCVYYTHGDDQFRFDPEPEEGQPGRVAFVCDNETYYFTLHEGYDFWCPMRFRVQNVSYERPIMSAASTVAGHFDTLVLPFDLQQACYYRLNLGEPMEIASMKDYLGNGEVMFAYENFDPMNWPDTQALKAYTPYLIRSLYPSELQFWASDVTIKATPKIEIPCGPYTLVGSTCALPDVENAYFMKDEYNNGFNFYYSNEAKTLRPFRACFVGGSKSEVYEYLKVILDKHTGIETATHESRKGGGEGVYTLSGLKIERSQMHKGIYIIDGKKVVVD